MKLLAGIRVVELGLWVAGPATAGVLADWGAEVVKFEMPTGDPMRRLYSAVYGMDEDRCPPFELYNRGKKSVALDINQPEGLSLVHRLIASADVFLTNMRPRFLARVQLDHETLLARHPALVYASLTAYGLDGPDSDAPGYDMAAFSGRSGIAERATPRHWPGTLAALGCPELEDDPRFATPGDRRRNAEALVQLFDAHAARRSREEWAAVFAAHDVWWAPINSIHDIMADPQVIASGAYARIPEAPGGPRPEAFNGVSTPVDFSRTPSAPEAPSPAIGADADALLGALGVDAAELARLRAAGVLAPVGGAARPPRGD